MIPGTPSVIPVVLSDDGANRKFGMAVNDGSIVGMFRLYLSGSSNERIFVMSNRNANDIVSGPHTSEADARKWMKNAAKNGLMGITAK